LGLLVWWIACRPLPVVVVLTALLYKPIGTAAQSPCFQGQLRRCVAASGCAGAPRTADRFRHHRLSR
jgi:hypothetical protein